MRRKLSLHPRNLKEAPGTTLFGGLIMIVAAILPAFSVPAAIVTAVIGVLTALSKITKK